MDTPEYSLDWCGRTLTIQFPNWAEQTNGSALVRYGDTVVLATAVMASKPREGINFFPLMVDYQEKLYAAGRIKGSRFIKREGRPTDDETLTGRMIDRSLRPRFDHRMRNDVQVVVSVLSYDGVNEPDVVAFIAASAALHVSDIPWDGPVAMSRVGTVGGAFAPNPTIEQMAESNCEIMVAGTNDRINMLEAGAHEMPEDEMEEAILLGFKNIQEVLNLQTKIRKEIGKEKKAVTLLEPDEALRKEVLDLTEGKLEKALFQEFKQERMDGVTALQKEVVGALVEKYPNDSLRIETAKELFENEVNRLVHEAALQGKRVDGRGVEDLRAITATVGVLPRVHGSGLFMRGLTHVLATCTLGAPGDAQIIERLPGEEKKRFMLHYNFPGFSVGEASPMRSPGRREIGHGALAERAVAGVIPPHTEFPYTIRLVCETLSSNGSSSMGSACSGSLALMDAGVPLKAAVAGIAIGLMSDGKGKAQVLTDIQGPEDHHGDMDFKVAGSREGITAIQMDVKIEGITPEILKEALRHGKQAREKILDVMQKSISAPRKELSPYAPMVQTIKIDSGKIGAVIGTGGKVINDISETTGSKIDIEDDGTIFITSKTQEGGAKAREWIENLTYEPKIGDSFQARVVKITDFGAFVEFLPGQEGLVHVSELSNEYVKNASDVVKEGDIIPVKVIRIDDKGRVALSAKTSNNESGKSDH